MDPSLVRNRQVVNGYSAPTRAPIGPAVPDVGVLAFVPDSWKGLRQPRHQVLFRLSRYFHVAWVQPLPHWREVLHGDTEEPEEDIRMEDLPPGLHVEDPGPHLPFIHRPRPLGRVLVKRYWDEARRSLVRRGCQRILLYLWRPDFASALDLVNHDASCYHVDDEYTFSDRDEPVSSVERRVLEGVDQVFIHSPALLEKKGHLNPRTRFVPNGVDYEAFSRPVPEPEDLAEVARPRAGYAGMLKSQLDWDLLEGLARHHADWSFVFVGAEAPQPGLGAILERVNALPNTHFLGAKSSDALAAYPQHFDVCMMPYRSTDYTRYINPLKLYEYLASGRPVVATRLPTLESFQDVVSLVDSRVEAWSAALDEAFSLDDDGKERQARARTYDWDLLVHGVAEALVALVRPSLSGRLPSFGRSPCAPHPTIRSSVASRSSARSA